LHSKANISQLNLLSEPKTKKWKSEKLKSNKRICSEIPVTVWGIRGVSPEEEKEGYGGKD